MQTTLPQMPPKTVPLTDLNSAVPGLTSGRRLPANNPLIQMPSDTGIYVNLSEFRQLKIAVCLSNLASVKNHHP